VLTVGNFAILCACGPKTLRYYDRVGLLKPARVDRWTGYRYYEESQVLDYRRIRSLQGAGFTIGEIKALLHATAEDVRAALRRKESELTETLRQLHDLQYSGFPAEDMEMEKQAEEARRVILALCDRIEGKDLEETGLEPSRLEPLKARLKDYWEGFLRGETALRAEERRQLSDTGWHREGWEKPAEAIRELPELADGGTYYLEFSLKEPRKPVNEHYLNVMIGAVLLQNEGRRFRLGVEPVPVYSPENRMRLFSAEWKEA
jgi:DNA-binding transcriptional MerR regulator